MKKLFFTALAVSCISATSFGITLSWKTDSTADWLNSVTSSALVYTNESTPDINSVIDVAKGNAVTGYTQQADANFVIDSGTTIYTDGALESQMTGTYYFVLFDNTKNQYAWVSVTAELLKDYFQTSEVGGIPPDPMDYDLTDASWAGTLVPEPTVLALLALGVAGLALRRRNVA